MTTNQEEREWEKEFEERFGGEGRYLCLYNERMEAYTFVAEEMLHFIRSIEDEAYKRGKEEERDSWKHLVEELYFVEGLEELRNIGFQKRKYGAEWSKTHGEKFCQIFFALLNGTDPKDILARLSEDTTNLTDKK